MKAVIIGSTGLVGQEILNNLLKLEQIEEVISLARRKQGSTHQKLIEIMGSDLQSLMQDSKTLDAIHGAQLFYCALGSTIKQSGSKEQFKRIDFDLVFQFAKLAEKEGAKLSVISAKGANSKSLIFYNKVKGQMEATLLPLQLSALYFFRPSLLKGERAEYRVAESIMLKIINGARFVLPELVLKSLQTEVKLLAQKVVRESLEAKGLKYFEAEDI